MNASSSKNPIEKAEEIIEKFGGIRPMAKKMDVAVTTVQGWKKRDTIPAARREALIKAAQLHDVDISDLLEGAEALAVSPVDEPEVVNLGTPMQESKENPPQDPPSFMKTPSVAPSKSENFRGGADRRPPSSPTKKMSPAAWINMVLAIVLVAAAVLVALFWPHERRRPEEDRLKALEQQVAEVEERQSFFGTLIPENLDTQLEKLREQAGQAQEQLGQVVEKAQEISEDVLAQDAGTLEERATKLSDHLREISNSPALVALQEKLQIWCSQQEGQEQIGQAVAELSALVGSMGGQMDDFGARLHEARLQSTALNRVFDGVPASELKAAALLLGMNQFRSSLNRDNEPFADDLQVLKNLIGDGDPALLEALERLTPRAEEGVLTLPGLGQEFKTVAGDAVVASLKGEDVALSERAKARMNDVLQIEKDGELLTGTHTQAALLRTEKFLDSGDLPEAIQAAETIEGPAAETIAPWIRQAEATLRAQKVNDMLEQIMDAADSTVTLPGEPRLIHDEATGINILKSH
ncbi:MAG: hypothetical protein IT559_00235 [Alphaproteobacteria bacterium]|nr:hypothetical protein [Alphaproteobacteria bacterium]